MQFSFMAVYVDYAAFANA